MLKNVLTDFKSGKGVRVMAGGGSIEVVSTQCIFPTATTPPPLTCSSPGGVPERLRVLVLVRTGGRGMQGAGAGHPDERRRHRGGSG